MEEDGPQCDPQCGDIHSGAEKRAAEVRRQENEHQADNALEDALSPEAGSEAPPHRVLSFLDLLPGFRGNASQELTQPWVKGCLRFYREIDQAGYERQDGEEDRNVVGVKHTEPAALDPRSEREPEHHLVGPGCPRVEEAREEEHPVAGEVGEKAAEKKTR